MPIQDTLQRFIFEQVPIRGEFIRLEESFQTIVNQHTYPPVLHQLLGEALCVAGLLSAIIKFSGRLTVQFRGKGKLKLLLAQCDDHLCLRGLAKWDGEMSSADLKEALNDGVLAIMIDAGMNNSSYQGIVSWQGGSLADSIEGYFRHSEQLATKIWLEVNQTTATGLLLQVIPASGENNISGEHGQLNPHWERITQSTHSLSHMDMLSMDCQSLLKILYPEELIRLFSAAPVAFGCTCSRKRSANAIAMLGEQEAEDELKDKQNIVVTCDFCNKEYIFDRVDVAEIFKNKDIPPADTRLH
jgi:molecular chaperone Hsp33